MWDGFKAIGLNIVAWFEICLLTCSGLVILTWIAWLVRRFEKEKQQIDVSSRTILGLASQALTTASAFVLCIMVIERCRFWPAAQKAVHLESEFPKILLCNMVSSGVAFLIPTAWVFGTGFLIWMGWLYHLSFPVILFLLAGAPVFLLVGGCIILAILNLAYICAVYLAVTRRDEATRKNVGLYFPGLLPQPSV